MSTPTSVWISTLHWIVAWNGAKVTARPVIARNSMEAMPSLARNEPHPVRSCVVESVLSAMEYPQSEALDA